MTVTSAQVILDQLAEDSGGLGLGELNTQENARQAINAIDGTDLCGRI